MPTLPPRVDTEDILLVTFELRRDVEAAMGPRRLPFLTLPATGRVLEGAASLLTGSAARSARVFLAFEAGSGTGVVSGLSGSPYAIVGSLQPEGLCFMVVVGCGRALRVFIPASWSSPRARGGEVICEANV